MPRRTYVLESEGRRKVHGIEGMKAKDRIKVFLCTNADGSHKVPLRIIKKGTQPSLLSYGEAKRRVLQPEERVG